MLEEKLSLRPFSYCQEPNFMTDFVTILLESINKLDHYYSTNQRFSNDLSLFCHLDNVSAKLVESPYHKGGDLTQSKNLKALICTD